MKYFFWISVACLSVFSCGRVELDGSTRLVAEGVVTDAAGTPLPNVTIDVNVRDAYASASIQTLKADADGRFKIAFLGPRQKDAIINISATSDDPQLLSTSFNGLKKRDFNGFYSNIGTIKLFRETELVTLQINYDAIVDGAIRNVYVRADGALYASTDITLPNSFLVAPNQQAILHYTRVAMAPGESDQEEEVAIAIGSTDTIFNFTL